MQKHYTFYLYHTLIACLFIFVQANTLTAQCDQNLTNYSRLGTFGNSVYYLSNVPSQPIAAESAAIALGGHLVDINSQAENDFIQSMIDEMTYIGLNDSNSEGNLRWTSNEAVTFTNFDNCVFCNENNAENDYAMMHPWNGGWSFMNRWNPRRYIVELNCSDTGGENGGGNTECLTDINGFEFIGKYGDSNYFISTSTATWANANTIAVGQGGTLVVIDDAEENQFLANKFDEMVYIGLNDANNEGQLSWADGSTNAYENFDDNCGFCNDNDAENDYVIIHPWNAEWSFTNQWSQRRYIMEIGCDEGGTSLTYTNCPQDRTIQLQTGQTRAIVNWTPPGLSDNCTVGVTSNTQTAGPNNGSNLSAGEYTITYRGTNNCGDIATCSFEVRVLPADNPPGNSTVSFQNCPADRVIIIPDGESMAYVSWTNPSVSSTCILGGLSLGLITGPNNGSNLPAGPYMINYRAVNNCGDIATCSFTINVMRSDTPSSLNINCSSNLNLEIPAGSVTTALTFISPTVNNVCDIPGTIIQQVAGPARNSQVGPGSYFIQYRATNNCNDETFCSFNVSVIESNSSTITVDCPQDDQTFTVDAPPLAPVALWIFEQPTYNNTCTITENGADGVSVSGPNAFNQGSSLSVGSFTATYTASNLCGDVATCSWNVEVLPSEVPTTLSINCPNPVSVTTSNGSNNAFVSWAVPTAITNCSSPGTNITQIGGPQNNSNLAIGNYTVSYRVTNLCGDQEDCSFQVSVIYGNNGGGGQVGYTANDQVTPYSGLFRPGSNVGYNPPWTDEQMADLVAGNPALGVKGIGAKSMRPGLFESITEVYGVDFRLDTYDHYASLGLDDLTMIVGFPADWHRDQTDYCGNGFNSSLFANLYTDIWDDGANGTPYNDDNYYAAYLYEVVSLYGSNVKFWEIWNEPGFDLTGNRGWRQPGDPAGNWWDNDPDPCEYILRAPIEHYVRTLRISWEIIKTLHPDDYVTVAGVGYVSFLDAIMRNTDNPNGGSVTAEYPLTGGAYFDMMGFHSYPDIDGSVYDYDFATDTRVWHRHSDRAAQGIKTTQDNYQVILDKYGYDGAQFPKKEWIITEINVPRIPFRADAMSGGEEMQVNYIIKAVAVAMQNDVTQMHVYNLGDKTTEAEAVTEFDLYGLHKRLTGTDAYTQVRNQEAIAYKSAADFVWGSRYDATKTAQMNLPNNVDGVALRLDNGRYKYIIWAKTTFDQSEFASATYSFPASFGYGQVYRRMWNFTDTDQINGISSNNIVLSGRPIFITETASNNELAQRTVEGANRHLSVYDILPNPAVDEVKLILEANESGNQVIQIYNSIGQLVEERETFLLRGFSEERFDISEYVHGMYYVLIKGAVMRDTEVKFVKAEK